MTVEDLMKENLDISGEKLEIMSERQLGVALENFVFKEQRKNINENLQETLRRQHKWLVKMKREKDKNDQEGGLDFMITTAAAVWEVCVVKGDKARERA